MIPFDRPLVITDTETTGIDPRRNRIIEIAATRIIDGEESVSFEQLIDPGISIPYRITRLTGITTAMVFGQPMAEDVIPSFFGFLGNGILVAHNLAFDRGFLDTERGRLGLAPMTNHGLCTLRLARRLLPGLRSKSLGSLAKFFRIASHGRHRALRDVEITTTVLKRLIAIAADEHGVTSVDELLDMQTRTYARINPYSRHILTIRKEVLPDLPDEPGVYRMIDGRGRVLYVGKAKVLASRVRSYFNAIEAQPPRIRQLIGKLRNVEWTVTETELEALLLESRQIRELDPPFNRAQKRTISRPFLRIDTSDLFPRITSHVYPKNDGAEYYGPFRTRNEVKVIIDIITDYFNIRTCDDREFSGGRRCLRADIGRCPAPCEGEVEMSEYADEIDGIRRFLAGDIDDILEQLESDMLSASDELAFEQAARSRDSYELLDSLRTKRGCIARRILDDDAAVLHCDDQNRTRDVLLIRSGVFVSSVRNYEPRNPDSVQRMRQAVEEAYSVPIQTDTLRTDANQIRVLGHWLFANRSNTRRIERLGTDDNEVFVSRITDAAEIFFKLMPEPVEGNHSG